MGYIKALHWSKSQKMQFFESFSSFRNEIDKKEQIQLLLAHHELFEPGKPLAVVVGVVGGTAPCCVPTWVECAKNNPDLKKIE